jgi:tRNA pseudouridine55 synthase
VTSFGVLGGIKRSLGTGKVGHAGTLDRFARGLLVVLCGRCTRLVDLVAGYDKIYTARLRFGTETSTLDPEGEVVGRAEVPDLARIEAELPAFLGSIEQTPPAYSAVHKNGERAWRMARRGIDPALEARRVTIHRLSVVSWNTPDLDLEIVCAKGTYVRALARDLGLACGSRAHVTHLVRDAVGPFRLDEACAPEELDPAVHLRPPEKFLPALPGVAVWTVSEQSAQKVCRGGPIGPSDFAAGVPEPGEGSLAAADGSVLAFGTWDGRRFRYRVVFAASAPDGAGG